MNIKYLYSVIGIASSILLSILGSSPIQDIPLKIQVLTAQTAVAINDTARVTLVINNESPYEITDIKIKYQGQLISKTDESNFPIKLSPYTSAEVNMEFLANSIGSQNIVFTVQYVWVDTSTNTVHQHTVADSSQLIEVTNPYQFEWPSFIIPLVIGFITGQIGALARDYQEKRKRDSENLEQVKGISLAILQSTLHALKEKEIANFSLWEDLIIKGNLYLHLNRLGKKSNCPDLAEKFARLSILIADYNLKRSNNTLTIDFTSVLEDQVVELINVVDRK